VPEPNLTVSNVSVGFGSGPTRVQALSRVSLAFNPGSLTVIMGPSGSGKTTLLSVLGCLMPPDEGSVSIEGREITGLPQSEKTVLRRDHIGFIFQAFRLFRSLSAFENVMIAAEISGSRNQTQADRARALLTDLGLSDRLTSKPNALSGGEKQRVAIARALMPDPKILLADEPTAALDSKTGQQIFEILIKLAEEQNRTVVVVSHDPRWTRYAHRTVILEDGRLIESRGIAAP
jgi:putative ABC transport system ATP-binding protein